jgi:uncharacterized protein YaaN involved in tellurite resistance
MLKIEIIESQQEILVDALNEFITVKEAERKRHNRNDNQLSKEAVDELDMFYFNKINDIKLLRDKIENHTEAVI